MEELTFTSEEERRKALEEIPEKPPAGTKDIDSWQEETDRKIEEIESAKISDSETPEEKPEEKPSEEAPKPPEEPEEEETLSFQIKRSELPDELQAYKNEKEILKQFAHARRYANESEKRLNDLQQTIAELKSKPEKSDQIEKAQKAIDKVPESPKKKEMQTRLNDLKNYLSELDKIQDDDYVAAAPIKKLMSVATEELNNLADANQSMQSDFTEKMKQIEQRYAGLDKEVKSYKTSIEEEKAKQQTETIARSFNDLQNNFPELKTSLPLVSKNGKSVESAVVDFCRSINGGKPVSWDTVNKWVSMYNQGNQEIRNFCSGNGIMPGNYGITDKDMENYAIAVNVYNRQQGRRINPQTGQVEELTDFRGFPIRYQNYEEAYKSMLDEAGITQKQQENNVKQAAIRAQESMSSAINKRDISDKVLGPESGGSPDKSGQELSKELAYEIIGYPRETPKTINQTKMDTLIRKKNKKGWEMWDMLKKAEKALGLPTDEPDPSWPQRPENA